MNNQWQYYQQYNPYYQQQPPISQIPNQKPVVDKADRDEHKQPEANNAKPAAKASLADVLEKIYEKLNKIEEENQELKDKIENMKPITIENINYKIQDLSVQELSGTLLVGLTSLTDAEELKKLLTENGPVTLNDIDTEDFEDIINNGEEQLDNNDDNNNI